MWSMSTVDAAARLGRGQLHRSTVCCWMFQTVCVFALAFGRSLCVRQTAAGVACCPCRTNSFFNPVFVQPDEDANAAETPAASPSPAPGPSQTSSVSISLGGEGATGVAVVNTQCAVNGSLSMLLTGTDATGGWDQPRGTGSSDGNTTTTTTGGNSTTTAAAGGGFAALNSGGNAANMTAVSSPAVGENTAGVNNTGGPDGQTGSNATTNAVGGNAAGTA